MAERKRVAVLMGGWSAEREVSLTSGQACVRALAEAGYDAVAIDVRRDLPALLADLEPRPDVVFNALHGPGGEDGMIQGVLEILNLPYTHSGILASALAMHKPTAKTVMAAAGVRVPPGRTLPLADLAEGHPLEPPYIVKPVDEGSSIGVHFVWPGDNRPPIDPDWPFGSEVLAEPYIPGRELTVAVMGDRALAVTEIRPREGFYSYEAKYTDGRADHIVPAELPDAVTEACLDMALAAHRALGCTGVSRADFRWDDGRPGLEGLFLLEVNTQPGMTPLSLVPEQAAHRGIDFPTLCSWMVENASCHA